MAENESQPYLQHKGELEDKDAMRPELEAQRHGFEMMVNDIRTEVQGSDAGPGTRPGMRNWLSSLHLTHELVGEEFSRELQG